MNAIPSTYAIGAGLVAGTLGQLAVRHFIEPAKASPQAEAALGVTAVLGGTAFLVGALSIMLGKPSAAEGVRGMLLGGLTGVGAATILGTLHLASQLPSNNR